MIECGVDNTVAASCAVLELPQVIECSAQNFRSRCLECLRALMATRRPSMTERARPMLSVDDSKG